MEGILFTEIDYNRYRTDFGRRAADYARYRQGFPPELFRRLAAMGVGVADQRLVDLGTGTGTLARGFAARGCAVTGLDVSADMLAAARMLAPEITFSAAPAEDTGLPAGQWDVVSAGQCWHWFDRPAALVEARRLLRPGGALVIAHMDWRNYLGETLDRTLAIVREHHPTPPKPVEWPVDGIYSCWLPEVEAAGFGAVEVLAFDVDLIYTHEGWRGRMRASVLSGAALSDEAMTDLDRAIAEMLAEEFPDEPMIIPHRVCAVVAYKDKAAMRAPAPM